MFLRAIRVLVAGALVAAVAVPACGNTSDSEPTASGGTGGSGAAGAAGLSGRAGTSAGGAPTLACGTSTCTSVPIAIPNAPALTIDACCSDADTNHCGLDSSFLAMFGPTFPVACQPLDQPGTLDPSCPDSPKTPVTGTQQTIYFPGCCRANGSCGYQLDTLGGIFRLGLGCVDSTPFLDGGTPQACGDSGGAGGASAAGGAGVSGGAGAAGETASGGVAGR
jgi:hypothetical protein